MHIAKTAGSSFERDLRKWAVPTRSGEFCAVRVLNDSVRLAVPSTLHVTLLRTPRAHVLSQYLMCTHRSPWITAFDRPDCLTPRSGNATAGLLAWVSHFASGWTPRSGEFPKWFPEEWHAPGWEVVEREGGLPGSAVWRHAASGAVSRTRPFKDMESVEKSKLNQFNDWQCVLCHRCTLPFLR